MDTFRIRKFSGGEFREADDPVAGEVPFTINLGARELATLLCSPSHLRELAYGFLYTSGVISGPGGLKNFSIDETRWTASAEPAAAGLEDVAFRRLYTPGCGRGTMFYSVAALSSRAKVPAGPPLRPALLPGLLADFQKRAAIYAETGGTHSAALAGEEGIGIFMEDIGRHNAVDKVIGARLLAGGGFKDSLLLSSGRVSSDLMIKAMRCRIPAVVARGAPTGQAVLLAREAGITLIGFARGRRFNVYSGASRISS